MTAHWSRIAKSATLLLLLAAAAPACVTSHSNMYLEPSIPRGKIHVQRIAVVPNRLPANLLEPERWRRFNWGIIHDTLTEHGYEVIDYDTSVRTFERSGLPVEDTKSSRDKYADLAQQLAVDAIIVPYYGTFAYSKNLIVINSAHFSSVTTLQVYVSERNDFAARIDADGTASFTTGYMMLAGIGFFIGGAVATSASAGGGTQQLQQAQQASQALDVVGGVLMLSDLILAGVLNARSVESYWEKAFQTSITEALDPFMASFPRG